MSTRDRITIDEFKAVTRAIAESDHLGVMGNHLTQQLVTSLGIKGCSIFVLNPDTRELEILATFGLSIHYINKGPIYLDESTRRLLRGEPVVRADVAGDDALQYPEHAREEGIRAMVTVPIRIYGQVIGALRLYDGAPWDISEKDLDSLIVLAETVGLALTYTRLLNAVQAVRGALCDLPAVLAPPGGEGPASS